MIDKLAKLLDETGMLESKTRCDIAAGELFASGVVALPCGEVYYITSKGTPFAEIASQAVDDLTLFEVKNLSTFGYFETREEAEQALKGGVE